jgi:phage baseplate assembly protein gpV
VLYGPISAIDHGALTVLGQQFAVPEEDVDAQLLAGSEGQTIYLEAALSDGVLQARNMLLLDDYAVPGVTPVFVSGTVSSTQTAIGTVNIGDVVVDVNSVGATAIEIGSHIAVTGTQPDLGGIVLAQGVLDLGNDQEASQEVTNGLQSISGSSGR